MHSLTTAKKRRDAEVVNVGVDHVTCIHNRGNPNLFAFGQSYSRCCGVFVFWLVGEGRSRSVCSHRFNGFWGVRAERCDKQIAQKDADEEPWENELSKGDGGPAEK